MPLQKPVLLAKQLLKEGFKTKKWMEIGGNETWKMEECDDGKEFRIRSRLRPVVIVACDSSLEGAKLSFEQLVEATIDLSGFNPVSLYKAITAKTLENSNVAISADEKEFDLADLEEAAEKEAQLQDPPSDGTADQTCDPTTTTTDAKEPKETLGNKLSNWIMTSPSPVAKSLLWIIDPFIPKPSLSLTAELKRGDRKKFVICSALCLVYCFIIRYVSFDFFLLVVGLSFYTIHYLVMNWTQVQAQWNRFKKDSAKKLVKQKINHRLKGLSSLTKKSS